MENNRYNNSKIYKLVDQVNGYFYIGSTCNPLSKRLYNHKNVAKIESERKVYKYFNQIGWENVKIVLVEEHYLENKEQLTREEDKVIQIYLHDEKCLNSRHASTGLSKIEYDKKYREDHHEHCLQEGRKYYNDNKESINTQRKEKMTCECGSSLRKADKAQHDKTDKHLTWLYGKDIMENLGIDRIVCACGSNIRKKEKIRHNQSKKHQAWLHDLKTTAETI